jgi:hypothetical protein
MSRPTRHVPSPNIVGGDSDGGVGPTVGVGGGGVGVGAVGVGGRVGGAVEVGTKVDVGGGVRLGGGGVAVQPVKMATASNSAARVCMRTA